MTTHYYIEYFLVGKEAIAGGLCYNLPDAVEAAHSFTSLNSEGIAIIQLKDGGTVGVVLGSGVRGKKMIIDRGL